jgi:uncharacterized protein YbjT (DUF2867 family)
MTSTDESAAKVIVVFGATGAQGGSVVRAMKDDKRFVLKAATRNPDSDQAKALVAQGVDVVKVDMDDVESTKKALQGAYGVFLVTSFWPLCDMDREIKQGKNVIDAAKESNLQHLVFSSLDSAKEAVGKAANHMETKVEVQRYIAKQGIPCTVVRLAAYYENLLGALKPQKTENGEFIWVVPMEGKPLDMVCVSEIGECIHQIFVRPDEFKGQNIGLSSSRATTAEYTAILSKVLEPKKFVASDITVDQYSKLGFPGADDFAAMFAMYQSGKSNFDVELTRKLNPSIATFEKWVDQHRNAFD